LYFSFGSKEKYQKKTTIWWVIAMRRIPNDVPPHDTTQQKQQKKKTGFLLINLGRSRFFLYFSFGSKEKYQKKTAIYWTVAGARTPTDVQPHAAAQQKQQKRKPAFPP
jgi:hypothetical protein